MSNWETWTVGVCAVALGCTGLERLLPSGSLKKTAQYITALFFLCILITPLTQLTLDFSVDAAEQTAQTAELEAQMRRQLTETVRHQTEEAVRSHLEQIGVMPIRLDASLSVDTDRVTLDAFRVTLDRSDYIYESTVRARVTDLLGLEPEIDYAERGKSIKQ